MEQISELNWLMSSLHVKLDVIILSLKIRPINLTILTSPLYGIEFYKSVSFLGYHKEAS